jgi:hypothetical protein
MDNAQRERAVTAAGRLVRGWRFDHNPLRRVSDQVETAVMLLLVALFLAGAPLAALAGGAWAHAAAQRTEAAETASRWLVAAVVVTTAPAVTDAGYWNADSVTKVRVAAPDGAAVTKQLPVPAGTPAGTRLHVWATRDGQVTPHPMSQSQVAEFTAAGQAAGAVAAAWLLVLAVTAARWSIGRRRSAAWDADWQATAPRWTTRT